MSRRFWSLLLLVGTVCAVAPTAAAQPSASTRPNVLFIAIDDLNHWIGHLNRNPQTITPNVDRLASRGVSFSHAYCAAPACNPSRAALMSGMRPSTTGVYHNPDDYRPHIRPDQTLNSYFRDQGYLALGAGKIYHGGGGRLEEWNDYQKRAKTSPEKPLVKKNFNGIRWAQLGGEDDSIRDYHTVSYCIEQLKAEHDQPLFLACGIFRPHMPWAVPKKYYDMHPLKDIQLPPHIKGDLEDIPSAGVRTAKPDGDHAAITKNGVWKEAVQAYLASITYADAQLGRLLDAFDQSAIADNTVIVLWGDHGWHLGEKQHWRKFALWEEATRAPLIWVAPGVTPEGAICERTVDFTSVYPTLCELAGLEIPEHCDGVSIKKLLRDPKATWDRPALTTHGYQRHAVRSEQYRYIRYDDGSEELYDEQRDPYEWKNLATNPDYKDVIKELAKWMPETETPPHPENKR
ncbi:sulfatase [Roseiconus nitratireducens]|uniref:Sulfatase n=1 Tax=Roseiconus nitratireducens TaxID=2605748 RepID=A0A5M6D4Q5_9BACT|nr:sulfatase [Roseiconus nitratireducens]KAA5540175.1 sulfatase [Roseiconus nitratireducens]